MLPDGDGHEPDADRRAHVHDRLHPRHLGPQGVHRGARAPDPARRPDRAAEPRAVRRPHGPGDRGRRSRRRAARRAASSTSTTSATINETLGRESGDALIQSGRRAAAQARCATRTPWRAWAATSSASCRPDETDVETAAAIAWKVRDAFERAVPHRRARSSTCARASGSRSSRSTAAPPPTCCAAPSLAMRQAKQSGSGLAVFVAEPEDPDRAPADAAERAARRASRAASSSCTTSPRSTWRRGATTGVEALVRWQHPTAGLLMPGAVHARGGAQRADRAAHDVGARRGPAPAARRGATRGIDLTMAVNISARSLTRGSDLPDTVAAAHRHLGHRARHADPRAHRERADRRRGPGRPRAAARDGRAARDRRLRHRPLVARLPPAAADRRDQGRPLVRHEPRHASRATR